MIHVEIPFSKEKKLGIAYNEAMSKISDDDWMCFLDHDVLILTPDTIRHFYNYTEQNKNAGLLTCYTNRVHHLSKEQCLEVDDSSDIKYHAAIAKEREKFLYKTTALKEVHRISGFLMLISKRTWKEIKFNEQRDCLWVDTDFCKALEEKKKVIARMDGIYVWHSYRILKDVNDKSHLL